MALSTKNLFHYTNLMALKGILTEGFRFSLVKEELPIINPESGDVLLMMPGLIRHEYTWQIISFCDILIEQIAEHRQQYGTVAIGLSKEWAMSQGISPVRYVHYYTPINLQLFDEATSFLNHSQQYNGVLPFVVQVLKDMGQIPKEFDGKMLVDLDLHSQRVIRELMSTMLKTWSQLYMSGAHFRQYKGPWKDRVAPGDETERVFYDEREWRAAAFDPAPGNLTFKWKDVSHLLLESIEDKEEIIEHLNGLRDRLQIDKNEDVSRKLNLNSDLIIDA